MAAASSAAEAPISLGLMDDSRNPAAVRMEIKGPHVEKIRQLLQAKIQGPREKKATSCMAFGWDRGVTLDGEPAYHLDLMLGGLPKIYGRLREAGYAWTEDEDVAIRIADLDRERELKRANKEAKGGGRAKAPRPKAAKRKAGELKSED